VAVKEAVFPFARFPGVDPVLSPEMKSTGEVMGLDRDFATAFAKSQLGAGTKLPQSGVVFLSVKDTDKPVILPGARKLVELGFSLIATGGTQKYLAAAGVPVELVNKVAEGRPHIVDRIIDGDVALVVNTTEGWQSLKDSQSIRQAALAAGCPISPRRRPALPRWKRLGRCVPQTLKCARCKPIIADRPRLPRKVGRP
jgi:carbamoyl-phosphate synthase large subunit